MDNYIQISKLNDFYFCPISLFLRTIYNNYEEEIFYGSKISAGKTINKTIDTKKYSTNKHLLQNVPLYSKKYQLVGKADIIDMQNLFLIEQKTK